MDMEIQAGRAGECAGNLVAALTKGSREGIRRAFDEAVFVASEPARDTLEEEYRGVLAGILDAMPTRDHNHQVIVRMLRHVATNAPAVTRYPARLPRQETLAYGLC